MRNEPREYRFVITVELKAENSEPYDGPPDGEEPPALSEEEEDRLDFETNMNSHFL